ncbi:MAG: Rieske 2Fe-2S domain-containing protein [Scytonematopsis contorta HA4267-MV1]|jgi:cytochrome b6-f complex iron-sulfur subunit|nr:Rieske 2Fe-2S domain-containing protein [Scytonematopsis contorta HA4267-MV1]
MKRRELISLFGVAGIAAFLPVALAACSSEKTETTGKTEKTTTTAPKDWQQVGTVAELDKKGQLLLEKSPAGAVLVVGTSASKTLTAVNPTCTHSGCIVGWNNKVNKFECGCHGSEFALDGKVLEGPATEPLKGYASKIEKGAVFIKAV